MSDTFVLTGVPPREPSFGVRSETALHRLWMPVILSAINATKIYTLGSDWSKWNGEMDFQKNYDAGGRFGWARAGSISTSGVLYKDYQWDRNSELAPEYMFTGGYWYFRPRHDANKQADEVARLTDGKNLLLPFALDAENNETGMAARYVEKQLDIFINRLHNNTGKWPIIYTSKGFWSYPNINATTVRPEWALERDLWVANYTLAPNPALPVTWVTKGYKFWQFSADGNRKGEEWGSERPPGAPPPSIDLNRFPGDYVALEHYVKDYNDGVIDPPPPPEPPEPPPTQPEYVETTHYVNLRTDNIINASTRLCTMRPGTRLEMEGVDGDWVVVKAYVHGDYVKKG